MAATAAAMWMFALATSERDTAPPRRTPTTARLAIGLRIIVGLAFVAFGISHFV